MSLPPITAAHPEGAFLMHLITFTGSPSMDHWAYWISIDSETDIGVVIHATADVRNGFQLGIKRSRDLGAPANKPTTKTSPQWIDHNGIEKSLCKVKAPVKTLDSVEETKWVFSGASRLAANEKLIGRLLVLARQEMLAVTPSFAQSYAKTFVIKTLQSITKGRLVLILRYNNDEKITSGSTDAATGPEAVIYVNKPRFWTRILIAFDLGFSEAYMLQDIDCDDLGTVFDIYLLNKDLLGFGNPLLVFAQRTLRLVIKPTNNVEQARLNASAHYDTSNKLFASFLSLDMNYSCAHWSADRSETLQSAQERKVDTLLKRLDLSPEHHLLDIGCGWGDVIITAAQKYGCRVTGLTLAKEQKQLAEQRIKEAGLQDQVSVLLCDYRKAPRPDEGYDRIISIGMFEHVGKKYFNEYFGTISRLLHPRSGLMVIDGITMTNKMFNNKSPVDTFIDRYIFPGGYLPSINLLTQSLHEGSKGALEITYAKDIGPHYGKTLIAWKEKFEHNWKNIREDYVATHENASEEDIEAFRRMWIFYFVYCEAGFRSRIIGNYIICAAKTPEPVISYDSASFGGMLQ
ncbi:cyclopropane-fatty-acyl-phospholipid synthase [Talaromyces islandicus]|uniref:Cyclopropane-fatty-acyl-phospholipid synthase n=1 Tax=Talaromyces islandicus TaxID=28573 RepID=A0A0U1LYN2_TALIS|nr:cyclopropane-fatty-acyl-phospholipid synthase [Talaromyces islandicus]